MEKTEIKKVIEFISKAKQITAFTGAGISTDSGIQSFRGEGGLWMKYNPNLLEINYFFENPKESWSLIKELFIKNIINAKPNLAHYSLVSLEKMHKLRSVITQNIDGLHQLAGNKNVYEFHGNSREVICTSCKKLYALNQINLEKEIPLCPSCGGLLKPNFVFFGEDIPNDVYNSAIREAYLSDVFLIIGTSGEVMPASLIPHTAKDQGAIIIEVNTTKSTYSDTISDVFLKGNAAKILNELINLIEKYF